MKSISLKEIGTHSMKRILLTGTTGYINSRLGLFLQEKLYEVESISLRDPSWKTNKFSDIDVIVHLAAMVHLKENPGMEEEYYRVNRDLAFEVAQKAKREGVKHFIFISTMAVYGLEAQIGEEVVITKNSPLNPITYYGKSKAEAETLLGKIETGAFTLTILRPPMIYGPDCPGNFAQLVWFAQHIPIFPMIHNKRSMLSIDRFCSIVEACIRNRISGILLPQDIDYINTSLLVKQIAENQGRRIHLSLLLGRILKVLGKNSTIVNKAFGSLVYEQEKDDTFDEEGSVCSNS